MKKTITLLLAAAGFAAAATDPLEITWIDNEATLSESLDAISVVFTLDFESLGTNKPLNEEVYTTIFSWSGTTEVGSENGGVKHYFLDDPYYGDYYNDLQFSAPGNSKFGSAYVEDYVKAIIGYTYSVNEKACRYLTLIDANGNEIVKEVVEGSKTRDTLSISELTKHAAVGNIEVYGSVLSAEEMAAAMVNIANPAPTPSVPEPTTATLSLLALAGLAARRRRR